MTKIVCGHTTSLDGFITGAGDSSAQPLVIGGERLFQWCRYGVTPSK